MNKVKWLGHAGILVTGDSVTVAVDPYDVKRPESADLILITHDHYDHCSPEDIRAMLRPDSLLIHPTGIAVTAECEQMAVHIGDLITVRGVEIGVEPAYNVNKPYHPRAKAYAGFVFTVDGTTYYHTGDTDRIPEMKSIAADMVFLPVSGTFTMNAEEAAAAAGDMKIKTAVPIHWGSIVGCRSDAERFRALCRNQVEILIQQD